MTAPLDLAALRALLERATPGPWQVDLERERHALKEVCVVFGTDIKSAVVPAIRSKGPLRRSPLTTEATQTANLHLIVAAVNALPALLDELAALRRGEDAVRAFVAWLDAEDGKPDYGTQTRDTHPNGERIWREWFVNNLDLCARAKAKGHVFLERIDTARAEGGR